MKASGTTARISFGSVPLIPGTQELAERGVVPGGTRRNFDATGPDVSWGEGLLEEGQLILCDAQTSGGLLMSVAADKADALTAVLTNRGVIGVVIGNVESSTGVAVEVTS